MSAERPTLFLIAHKVRGEPAFDIATPLPIGDEDGWIIPTSGHRAYPYWTQPLIELIDKDIYVAAMGLTAPSDLPDHYRVSASPRAANPTATRDLLSSLGLLKPAEPIKRRI